MNPDLVKTPIVDKNGVHTTRNKRVAKAPTNGRAKSVKPKSSAAAKPSMKERLEEYTEELKQSVSNLANDDNWNNYLLTLSKFHNYSFMNQILIQIQTKGKATRVAGMKTWNELGRRVNAGEKAIVIRGYSTKKTDVTDQNGNPVYEDDGVTKAQRSNLIFFPVGVWDISQTSGEDLPTSHRKMTATPPPGLEQDLIAAINKEGFTIEYADDLGGANGSTSTNGDKVVTLLSSLNDAERAKVLAHELFHIKAGHIEKADQYHTGIGGERHIMEIEAESGAYVILRANGMDEHEATSSTYVAGWAGVRFGNDREDVIQEAAANVSSIAKKLLEENNWSNLIV